MRAQRKQQALIDASAVRVPGRAPKWVIPTVKLLLVITDAFAAASCFMLAFYWRESTPVFATGAFANGGTVAWSEKFAPYAALLLFVVRSEERRVGKECRS